MSVVIPDPRWESPTLLIPRVRPSGPVEIDWNHPLTRGLVGFWLGGDLKNYAAGLPGVITGSNIKSRQGAWVNDGDGTTDRIDLGSVNSTNPLCLAGQKRASFFHLFEWGQKPATNQFPRFIDKSSSGGGQSGYATYYDTGVNKFYLSVDGENMDSSIISETASNTLCSLGISVDLDTATITDAEFYYQGQPGGSFAAVRSSFPSTTTNAALLNWNHATDRENPWPVYFIALWSGRTLTADEHTALHNDPYQFLIPA